MAVSGTKFETEYKNEIAFLPFYVLENKFFPKRLGFFSLKLNLQKYLKILKKKNSRFVKLNATDG